MTDAPSIAIQRAAGVVLRSVKWHGAREHRLGAAARAEPLRPALAIESLLAAMRARYGLTDATVNELLRPALADWRDAVGCPDPLLVPANALGAAPEKHLLPIPMPSWCAALVDGGVLRLDGPPVLEGPRVVQLAWLAVIREAELTAVECFPIVLAGRYGSGAASLHVHLAVSPGFLDAEWSAPVLLRAGAQRLDKGRAPVHLWLGAPATPEGAAQGSIGEGSVTWVTRSAAQERLPDWPPAWPRWAVLRVLEGREPQALWELPALWRGATADRAIARASAASPGAMRLAIDIGSTSTVVAEEDNAAAGSVGANLLPRGGRRLVPSGFCRLGGDAATAHRVGCGEQLLAPGGQLPTALCAPGAKAALDLLRGAPGASDQLWLPQGPPDDGPLLLDRFKSPELLRLSEWVSQLPEADPAAISRQLLSAYARQLGRTLAIAHATPLVTPEGGQWTRRRPRLSSVEAVVTYPPCAFDAGAQTPFRDVFDDVGLQLCAGLRTAWPSATHRLVADPAAAAAVRGKAHDELHPIEALVDFGGLTLQVTVRLPRPAERAAPFIAGSSMSYLLGGERLIDAAAFAGADRDAPSSLRETYRTAARRWRTMIAAGDRLHDAEAERHPAVGEALLGVVLSLVRRQLLGTLRRAGSTATRGAGVCLHLLGEGWKLVALDAPDEQREAEAQRRIEQHLGRDPLAEAPLQLHRMTKRRVCEGALRVRAEAEAAAPALELQGIDVASGDLLRQRWFGLADAAAPDLDLLPHPADAWWRAFAGPEESLLRVEQWFGGPAGASPFQTRLAGGNLAFDGRRSVLKQWIDVSGPSLVALRVRDAI